MHLISIGLIEILGKINEKNKEKIKIKNLIKIKIFS